MNRFHKRFLYEGYVVNIIYHKKLKHRSTWNLSPINSVLIFVDSFFDLSRFLQFSVTFLKKKKFCLLNSSFSTLEGPRNSGAVTQTRVLLFKVFLFSIWRYRYDTWGTSLLVEKLHFSTLSKISVGNQLMPLFRLQKEFKFSIENSNFWEKSFLWSHFFY